MIPLAAIPSIPSVTSLGSATPSATSTTAIAGPSLPNAPTAPTVGAPAAGSSNFGNVLTNAITSLQNSDSTADTLAQGASTGNVADVSDYMIAAQEANVETQLAVAVRNAATGSFNQIMNMSF
jgi:flagellar hook-basal body complex protein FliE